jgi:hypothetical protein
MFAYCAIHVRQSTRPAGRSPLSVAEPRDPVGAGGRALRSLERTALSPMAQQLVKVVHSHGRWLRIDDEVSIAGSVGPGRFFL